MKVAMIAGDGGSGGLISYIKGILSADKVPNGWEVRLYCGDNLANSLIVIAAGVKVIRTNYASERGKDIFLGKKLSYKLINMINDFKPDLVLFLNGWIRYGLEQYPSAVILHNQLLIDDRQLLRQGLSYDLISLLGFRYRVRKSIKQADAVVFLSKASKTQTIEKKVRFNLSKVIDVGFEEENRLQELHFKPLSIPPKFIYISPLYAYKNQVELVRAFSLVKKNGIEFELRLVGRIDKRIYNKLRKIIKLNHLENNIIFYDQIAHEEVKSMIDDADIFVYASSMEITRYGLLEGMARGAAIICSDKVGLPEMLGDGGLYFNPEEVESIYNAITLILSDSKQREKCSQIAYERSILYSWDKAASELYEFLNYVKVKTNKVQAI